MNKDVQIILLIFRKGKKYSKLPYVRTALARIEKSRKFQDT